MSQTTEQQLQQQVQQALADKKPLHIVGGKSKLFYGHRVTGDECSSAAHNGIVSYKASELVITAKAGTTLAELEKILAEKNQMLAFEPPQFNSAATLGGCIAAGLSGPSRPFSGAVRDFVLGCKIINGKAEILHFGGEVMKNVAGYDVSRLMTGSMGTLGLLLEISLKVLPRPAFTLSLKMDMPAAQALEYINKKINQSLPITASCILDEQFFIRLSGAEKAVLAAQKKLAGDVIDNQLWSQLQHQQHAFFNQQKNLWRLSLPTATPPLTLEGTQLIEWHGAQRWLYSDASAEEIFSTAQSLGGHACLFKTDDAAENIFQPLHKDLMQLQKNIKQAMDPQAIFNPQRMYKEL